MIIRPASIQDLEKITEIYNEAVLTTTATFDTKPKTLEEQRIWFQHHGDEYPIIVALIDDQVVGWAALSRWSDRCAYSETAENSVYVKLEFRGRGVGRKLMEALLIKSQELGFHTIIARIADGSEQSTYLHQSLGFEKIGVMKEVGLKFEKRLDVHLMQKMLSKTALQNQHNQRIFSGAPWEKKIGYCRAIRNGNFIAVTGTVALDEKGNILGVGDPYGQAKRSLEIIEKTLKSLGASKANIIRTRMFVTDISQWQEFGKAHGEFFLENPPATSMLEVNRLIDPQALIEIEADAIL